MRTSALPLRSSSTTLQNSFREATLKMLTCVTSPPSDFGLSSERLDPFPRVFIPPCPYTLNIPALDYLSVAYGEIDLTDRQRRDARAIQDPEARDQFQNQCWNENHLSFIRWHRDFLTQGLKGSDPKVVQKYNALSQHHNWRVSQLYPGQEELLIKGGQAIDLSGAPT